jgi:hypothetical protein
MSSLRMFVSAMLVLCLMNVSLAEEDIIAEDFKSVAEGRIIIVGGRVRGPEDLVPMPESLPAAAPAAEIGTEPKDTPRRERVAEASSETNDSGPAAGQGRVNVRFADGSVLSLALAQEDYTFVTPYGKLVIPASEIQLLELAPRVPEEIAKRIEESVAKLGSPQYEIREQGAADLLAIGAKGYALLKRMKSSDLEVSSRLAAIVEKIAAELPDEQRNPREADVLHTANSRITGKLELDVVKADSAQFGEVTLKLADVRDLVFGPGGEAIDLSKLPDAPHSVSDRANQVGKIFTFKVTGNASGGTLWGTDVYTLDSSLAAAAVHAGVVKHGEVGVLRIKIVESPDSFAGSTRNGITSYPYPRYPAAYRVIRMR